MKSNKKKLWIKRKKTYIPINRRRILNNDRIKIYDITQPHSFSDEPFTFRYSSDNTFLGGDTLWIEEMGEQISLGGGKDGVGNGYAPTTELKEKEYEYKLIGWLHENLYN